ncbi:MAG: aspartate kinase [Rikenellaceae bacterium]
MQVYKFGGASVATAEGVKNITSIILNQTDFPIVVISAMGKMTNAFEKLLEGFISLDADRKSKELKTITAFHENIISDLGMGSSSHYNHFIDDLKNELSVSNISTHDYDWWYDRIVGYGEMLSTSIISDYLSFIGVENTLLESRKLIITDGRFREANINFAKTEVNLRSVVNSHQIYLLQGFIAGTAEGDFTTLGREGSDYTAAAVANMLSCESVTIWKDVEGVLNADPRIFSDCVLIPALSYVDAVELAFSGAQIIHPKTIKPLQNKDIPLHVRSFLNPSHAGSVICDVGKERVKVPIVIMRKNQILISIRPKDFSFVLEESLQNIFTLLNNYRQKVNVIQGSAVRISVSVDASRYLDDLISELSKDYRGK